MGSSVGLWDMGKTIIDSMSCRKASRLKPDTTKIDAGFNDPFQSRIYLLFFNGIERFQ